jgi:hypothetical protein
MDKESPITNKVFPFGLDGRPGSILNPRWSVTTRAPKE